MSFSQSLTALKIQIDDNLKKIEQLTNQNVKQMGEIGELMATIRKLEGQVRTLRDTEIYLCHSNL